MQSSDIIILVLAVLLFAAVFLIKSRKHQKRNLRPPGGDRDESETQSRRRK
ncbi:MAG: hypothetical protein ACREIA_02830 [Opitutaceae bacterium]